MSFKEDVEKINKLKTAEQDFYSNVTPKAFFASFNGGTNSTIVLNGITVKSIAITPPAGVKLSLQDQAKLLSFSYETAARTYAEESCKD